MTKQRPFAPAKVPSVHVSARLPMPLFKRLRGKFKKEVHYTFTNLLVRTIEDGLNATK